MYIDMGNFEKNQQSIKNLTVKHKRFGYTDGSLEKDFSNLQEKSYFYFKIFCKSNYYFCHQNLFNLFVF